MASYRFTREARASFDNHLDWLNECNPIAASRFAIRLDTELEFLGATRIQGQQARLYDGIRCLRWHAPPFLVYYRREGDTIVVLHLHHTARKSVER